MLSIFREDELPHNAFFGDGSPLCEDDLKSIRKAMAEEQRIFEWQRGDVLLCDNKLVMHGRQPFSCESESSCRHGVSAESSKQCHVGSLSM